MNIYRYRHAMLLGLFAAATACSAGQGESVSQSSAAIGRGIIRKPPPPKDQSFLAPQSWGKGEFTSDHGWNPSLDVRVLADVNHDGKQDIVGFGDAGVYLALSTGTSFAPAQFVLEGFANDQGWTVENHIRTLADVNGDGLPDLVGFGDDGVWTSLGTGTGFAPAIYVLADFGYNQGWRVDQHIRLLSDLNGDGLPDIIGFGNAGVYTSLNGPTGFGPVSFVVANFGADQGWNNSVHVRTTGDINGDGLQDIVAFGYDGVWTALSVGAYFTPPAFVLADYGASTAAGSWTAGGRDVRQVIDINGDHLADIVGFGDTGVYTSLSTGGGGFTSPTFALADFGFNQLGYADEDDAPRFLADFNGDGYLDIVAYSSDEYLRRSIGYSGGTFGASAGVMDTFSSIGGWVTPADVNGDGLPDLVGFGKTDVMVEISTASPVPAPAAAPSNLHVTAATPSSLTIAWDDNSTNELGFSYSFRNEVTGVEGAAAVGPNVTSAVITGLDSNAAYCIDLSSYSNFGGGAAPELCNAMTGLGGPAIALTNSTHTSLAFTISATGATALRWDLDGVTAVTTQSGSTATPVFTGLTAGTTYCLHAAQQVGTTWSGDSVACEITPAIVTGTSSLAMPEDPPPETGYISYSGTWSPGGRTITSFTGAYTGSVGIGFLKYGYDPTTDCGNASAVVYLLGGATLGASDIAQIEWPEAGGTIDFVGCAINMSTVASDMFVNVNWSE
jgi:hypothetical protein